jgi:hypothetical protein
MAYNTKLRLIDAKMEQPSGQTLTLSGNTIFDVGSDGIPKYSVHPDFTDATYSGGTTLVDKQYVDDAVVSGGEVFKFTEDIVVSIEAGKTFGRYENGDTIPASGKTPNEVILLATQEPITPTVSLTPTGTNVAYGESGKTVSVAYSYDILSLGASLDSFRLEWRRNLAPDAGTSNAWEDLIASTSTPPSSPFIHNIDDSNNRFATTSIEYRLTVVDSLGATGTTTQTQAMQTAGTASGTVTVTSTITSSTTLNREKADTGTTITTSTITASRTLNKIVSYQVQRQVNVGSWTNVGGLETITPTTSLTITPIDDFVAETANNVKYRIIFNLEDTFTYTLQSNLITFTYPYFWGFSATQPTAGDALLADGNTTKVIAASSGDLTINFGSSGTAFMWFATPATSTTKVWWQENGNPVNSGNIAVSTDLFQPPTTVEVDSPDALWSNEDYKFYIGGYDGDRKTYNLLNTAP